MYPAFTYNEQISNLCEVFFFSFFFQGKSALDAVEAATQSMEDSGVLNAGQGCYLTEEGTVELDAMIMDGQTLNTGKFIMVFCLYYN